VIDSWEIEAMFECSGHIWMMTPVINWLVSGEKKKYFRGITEVRGLIT